jgi:Protein of unknown function (DUF3106)
MKPDLQRHTAPPKGRKPHANLPLATWSAVMALSAALSLGTVHAQALDNTQWNELTVAQRQVLQPLQPRWNEIDGLRKQKWLDIAARFPKMTPEQQARTTSRMAEWAAMTPAQRNAARLQFEQVKQVPAPERQARWDAYNSLPAEQRDALSKQAADRKPAPVKPATSPDQPQLKSNIVDTSRPTTKPSPVAPATVQAAVGASTRPITQRPIPPRHQQAGMPKIAATPGFVDSATLLPQRGPQGAAVEPPRAQK